MTKRPNCWEIKKCGLGPEGSQTHEHGTCPACLPGITPANDGLNGGEAQGRVCWTVEGTLCKVDLLEKGEDSTVSFKDCINCIVFQQVQEEEERFFNLGLRNLGSKSA